MSRIEQTASERYRNADGQSYVSMLLSRHLLVENYESLHTQLKGNLETVFELIEGNRSKTFNEFLVKLAPSFQECWEKEPYEGRLSSTFFTFAIKVARNPKERCTWSKKDEKMFEDFQNSFMNCFNEYVRDPRADRFTLAIFSKPYTDAFLHLLTVMKQDFELDFGLLGQFLPFILAYQQHYDHLNHECEKLGYFITKNSEGKHCRLLAYEDPLKNIYVYGFNNANEFECCGRILPNGLISHKFVVPTKTFPLELEFVEADHFQMTAYQLWRSIPALDFQVPEISSDEDDDDNHSLGLFIEERVEEEPVWDNVLELFPVEVIKDLAQRLLQEIEIASHVDRNAIFRQHPEVIANALVMELDFVMHKFKTVASEIYKQDEILGNQKILLQQLLQFATDHTKSLTETFGAEEQLQYLIQQARVVNTHLKTQYSIAKAKLLVEHRRCPERVRKAAIDYLTEQQTAFNPDAVLPDAVGAINVAVAHTDRNVGKLADALRAEYEEAKEEIAKCVEMVHCSPNPRLMMSNLDDTDEHMRDDEV